MVYLVSHSPSGAEPRQGPRLPCCQCITCSGSVFRHTLLPSLGRLLALSSAKPRVTFKIQEDVTSLWKVAPRDILGGRVRVAVYF